MKNIFKILLLASLVALYSCKEDEDDKTFKLSGTVKNATENSVSNATITLTGDKAYTALTDANGSYSLTGIVEGTYAVSTTKTGYQDYSTSIIIAADNMAYDMSLLGDAIVSGTIINSQTGDGLDSAIISFMYSANKSTETEVVEFHGVTDIYGRYYLENVPVGTFVCIIEKEGFTPRTIPAIVINSGENEVEQSVLVESLEAGSLRIVLSWGESPSDLDSHLTGPDGMDDRFHMYYVNKNPIASVFLDVDDVSSYGPETTTISSFNEGTYRYSVFNFSDQSSDGGNGIANSPTVVEVYNHTGLIETFNAPSFPTGGGNTWRVFEVLATSQGVSIVPVNAYVTADDDNTADMKQTGKKKPMSIKNF